MIKLSNTLTGEKEAFRSIEPGKIKMYVCGVTPYDYSHVGHARAYISFDVLYRLFRFYNFEVIYCRNFTDVDDKLINRAEKEFGDKSRYHELAKKFITAYHEEMQKLNCLPPTYEPLVTEHITDIIEFIVGLIDAGKAYAVDGDVYFRIASFPEYGKLSRRDVADMRAGARIQVNEKKEDPLDFALWKAEPQGTFWQSPWGYGRPGWHIECSVLAYKYLGKHFDIHGGGLDLVFPHHENEIAQSQALHGVPFANYWVHNGMVRVDKEKMSKSLGNFFTIRDMFEKFDPMLLRYYILTHHYRAPMDFSFEAIQAAKKSYNRLCRAFELVEVDPALTIESVQTVPVAHEMVSYLADDLNTPGMLGVLFDKLSEIQHNPATMVMIKTIMVNVFGVTLEPLQEKGVTVTPAIEKLINAREQARKEKDWSRADALRDELKKLGYDVHDEKL